MKFKISILMTILYIISEGCRKDDCQEYRDNLQMDDTGIFICMKNPSMHGAPTPRAKQFQHVHCNLEGYTLSIG